MNKVLVKIKTSKGVITPKFTQCLVHLFASEKTFVKVRLKLEKDFLILKEVDNSTEDNHDEESDLHHSIDCPIKNLEFEGRSLSSKVELSIPVAVCIILESADNHVLLTRRTSHMRSSPGVWVPPGGHLEPGEGLLEGGLREVFEETGLSLCKEEITARVLCLFENVFPIILGLGEPKNHVLVVYYHVQSTYTHQQLRLKMKINPHEVQAFAWISPKVLAEMFVPCGTESYPQKQYIWADGKIVEADLKYLSMFNRYVWTSKKVYSGVQCSLIKWHDHYVSTHHTCKI